MVAKIKKKRIKKTEAKNIKTTTHCLFKTSIFQNLIYFFQSQAEAHYKGNRHARRIKGIETSKTTRSQDGDKQPPPPPASPSIAGLLSSSPKPDGNDKQGKLQQQYMSNTLCFKQPYFAF